EALNQRPEVIRVMTTLIPGAPQFFASVDRDKTLKHGVEIEKVYQTLQAFM
ncbi:MAG: hypothetical protein GTO40_19305, partial [Deltaproteobacteria bacterium]|nr:hypothetical protein [Deltaproteobacteria bacterium]